MVMNTPPSLPIIVVGAGWAGLTAAFMLAESGHSVTLLEAAPQAGGRARAISFGQDIIDNGQHLLLGAYTHTLQLLDKLNIPLDAVFSRQPLTLSVLNLQAPENPLFIPLPKHLTFLGICLASFKFKGLSLYERLKAAQFLYMIHANNFELDSDVSVYDFLKLHRQPIKLMSKLWAPIALAALSTPIEQASARVFLQVLKGSFFQKPEGSNWLFPKVNLSALLPEPILKTLSSKKHSILYNQRIAQLLIEGNRCVGVSTRNGEFRAQAVILATPPHTTAQLLSSHPHSASTCQALITHLEKIQYQPITTVYLRYSTPIQLPHSMIGIINGTAQWIFDRAFSDQPNILSVVITGTGSYSELNHPALVEKILNELKILLPALKAPVLEYRVVCEKRAAFSCDVGINENRPANATPVDNLLLAGDYIHPDYPATLEGAVHSGIKAAQWVLLNNEILI